MTDIDALIRQTLRAVLVADQVLDEHVEQIERLLSAARIDEINRKMTLGVDWLSSKDYKAGFNEALDQIDAANRIRIAELQSPIAKHKP